MTILNHTLGFPRVGLRRELKKAQESYWAGNSTREELLAVGRTLLNMKLEISSLHV